MMVLSQIVIDFLVKKADQDPEFSQKLQNLYDEAKNSEISYDPTEEDEFLLQNGYYYDYVSDEFIKELSPRFWLYVNTYPPYRFLLVDNKRSDEIDRFYVKTLDEFKDRAINYQYKPDNFGLMFYDQEMMTQREAIKMLREFVRDSSDFDLEMGMIFE